MQSTMSEEPRVYLAAERTLLAWIRTGLALMGFGFVVARFGLFLREVAAVAERGNKGVRNEWHCRAGSARNGRMHARGHVPSWDHRQQIEGGARFWAG